MNWEKIRLACAWPMIGQFAAGSIAVWWGAFSSLEDAGGFAGIASWRILAIILLLNLSNITYARVTGWDYKAQSYVRPPPPETRKRLWAVWSVLVGNVVANLFAIVWIVENLRTGRLEWAKVDTTVFIIAGLLAIPLFVWKGWRAFKDRAANLILGLATRAVPQVALAFSPDIKSIPWLTLGGIILTISQRFIVSGIEFAEAKSEYAAGMLDQESVKAAGWMWRGEWLNLATIFLPCIVKICP